MLAPRGNSNMWLRYLYLLTEQPSDFNSIAMRQVSFLARYVASCTSIGNYIRTLPAGSPTTCCSTISNILGRHLEYRLCRYSYRLHSTPQQQGHLKLSTMSGGGGFYKYQCKY